MTGYCWLCGVFGLLSRVAAWCQECVDEWEAEYATREDRL